MRRSILFLAAFLLFLAACTSALPETATPTANATQPFAPDQLNLFATQTQSAALASTAAAQGTARLPPAQPHTPSPLPLLTQTLGEVGPFRQESQQEALIMGKVLALQSAGDGFLLFSEGGISYYQDDRWTGYFTQFQGDVIGVDQSGRAWVAAVDGSQIVQSLSPFTAHREPSDDSDAWIVYGPEQGWLPASSTIGSPVEFGVAVDHRGRVWVTTQQDVRRFDGNWQVYDSVSMGMPDPAADTIPDFSLFAVRNRAEVYAGRCDWGSTGPVGGGGWRVFDGSIWRTPDSALNTGCVTAFAEDETGNVWITQDAGLWRYDLSTESLEQIPLPAPPEQQRYGYANGLTPVTDSSLLVQLALCSGETCFGGEAIYRFGDNTWQQIGEPGQAVGQRLLLDASGTIWLISAGSIYQVVENALQAVPGLVVLASDLDQNGKLWLVAQAASPATLWTVP